jgi:hypothetical protein
VLGGPDILAYLVLALGGAMAVGSILAVVRPPEGRREGDLEQAPLVRSLAFAAVGVVAALWALGSLLS